jgi:MFS family permease
MTTSTRTLTAATPLRRTLVLVSAIVCYETVLFMVLAPLLPHLADKFGLSKAAAGALVASYAAGAFLGAVPSGLVAARIGAKATALSGLLLLGLASVGFALAQDVAAVFAARLAQGVGCSLAWTGGFAWLMVQAPKERRGEVIGVALTAAIAGALLGPAVGALAGAAGTIPVFVGLAVPALLLAAWGVGIPAGPSEELPSLQAFARAFSHRRLLGSASLISLAGFLLGVVSVLAPLHLSRLGWGATGIGAVFLLSAAVNMVVNPALGKWSDRRRLAPVRFALVLSTVGSLALALSTGRWLYAAIVVAADVVYGLVWTPSTVLLSDAAAERGIGFVVGFAMMNLAWSPGQLIGSVFGGVIGQTTSDAVAYVVAAALCVVALAWTRSA